MIEVLNCRKNMKEITLKVYKASSSKKIKIIKTITFQVNYE